MEQLFNNLGFHFLIVGVLLGVFTIILAANSIIGCIRNIGIMKEKFSWPCLRATLLKLLGTIVAGLAGAFALTILPNVIDMAGAMLALPEEAQTLATSVDVIGVIGIITYLGKACIQYGKYFLQGFGELICTDSDGNGIPDGMSL